MQLFLYAAAGVTAAPCLGALWLKRTPDGLTTEPCMGVGAVSCSKAGFCLRMSSVQPLCGCRDSHFDTAAADGRWAIYLNSFGDHWCCGGFRTAVPFPFSCNNPLHPCQPIRGEVSSASVFVMHSSLDVGMPGSTALNLSCELAPLGNLQSLQHCSHAA